MANAHFTRYDLQPQNWSTLIVKKALKPARLGNAVDGGTEMPSDDQLDDAGKLIRILTGGRIDVYQQGEKKPKLGWAQARLKVNLAAVALNSSGIASSVNSEIERVADIRQPEETENPDIRRARELYAADCFETEIANELHVSRGCIFKWLAKSFETDGMDKPDGSERRKPI